MENLISQINTIGCYKFPFKESYEAYSILNENVTLLDYISNCSPISETGYLYTEKEKSDFFNHIVKEQRIYYKAALLVLNKKFLSINPALRSLGVKI